MACTRPKSKLVAAASLWNFIARWFPHVWYLTFTFHENVTDKAEAERRFKPLKDWFGRRGVEFFGVWERQKRGAWHLHILVNRYCDVNTLRPFLTLRGWGTQMRFERVGKGSRRFGNPESLIKYLMKYLDKQHTDDFPGRTRATVGTHSSRAGTVQFHWNTEVSRLWRQGKDAFVGYWGRDPEWDGRLWYSTLNDGQGAWVSEFYWVSQWVEARLLSFDPATFNAGGEGAGGNST